MKGLPNVLLPLALVGALAPAATGQVSALVAHWDFAETSGTTLADGSGNGLDLTLSGGVVLGSAGAHASTGSAAEFDASTQGLGRVANQVPLSGMRDNFSVAAWVRVEPGAPSAIRRVFGCGGAGWSCGVTANGYRFTTKGIQDFDLGVAYPQSTWFHYALVFDAAHDAHFYLDGALVGTVNGGGPSNAPSGDWLLGSWNGSIEFWHGAVDDVQVYEGSLTAAEVAFLYQNPGSTVSPAQGQIFCAGDGSASSCPCGNLGASDEGCGNSTGLGGHLGAFGTLSMTAGNLELLGERLPWSEAWSRRRAKLPHAVGTLLCVQQTAATRRDAAACDADLPRGQRVSTGHPSILVAPRCALLPRACVCGCISLHGTTGLPEYSVKLRPSAEKAQPTCSWILSGFGPSCSPSGEAVAMVWKRSCCSHTRLSE